MLNYAIKSSEGFIDREITPENVRKAVDLASRSGSDGVSLYRRLAPHVSSLSPDLRVNCLEAVGKGNDVGELVATLFSPLRETAETFLVRGSDGNVREYSKMLLGEKKPQSHEQYLRDAYHAGPSDFVIVTPEALLGDLGVAVDAMESKLPDALKGAAPAMVEWAGSKLKQIYWTLTAKSVLWMPHAPDLVSNYRKPEGAPDPRNPLVQYVPQPSLDMLGVSGEFIANLKAQEATLLDANLSDPFEALTGTNDVARFDLITQRLVGKNTKLWRHNNRGGIPAKGDLRAVGLGFDEVGNFGVSASGNISSLDLPAFGARLRA